MSNLLQWTLSPGDAPWNPGLNWRALDADISNQSNYWLTYQNLPGGVVRYVANPHQQCVVTLDPSYAPVFNLTATPPTADISSPPSAIGKCEITVSDRGLPPTPGVVGAQVITAPQQIPLGNSAGQALGFYAAPGGITTYTVSLPPSVEMLLFLPNANCGNGASNLHIAGAQTGVDYYNAGFNAKAMLAFPTAEALDTSLTITVDNQNVSPASGVFGLCGVPYGGQLATGTTVVLGTSVATIGKVDQGAAGTFPWLAQLAAGVASIGTVGLNAGANTIGKVNQGTSPWVVDGSAVTQPVSGTVTANQGGAPWDGLVNLKTAANANVHQAVVYETPSSNLAIAGADRLVDTWYQPGTASATAITLTQAAPAGALQLVCTGFEIDLISNNSPVTAGRIDCTIADGASNVLWRGSLASSATVGDKDHVSRDNLRLTAAANKTLVLSIPTPSTGQVINGSMWGYTMVSPQT